MTAIQQPDGDFSITRIYNAPVALVWKAISNNEDMKQWYFDLPGFKAETGFEFQFKGGPDEDHMYLHLCKVTEVIPGKRLSYSWRYDGYEGISFVTFELAEEEGKTRLTLTHSGLNSFPAKQNPDLAAKNFAEGWTMIIGTSLKEFVEKAST